MGLFVKFTVLVWLLVSLQPAALLARSSTATAGLVVADNELASQAGMEILKRGGNAVDAAIATALALSVVDQGSSGLGGGGFMVIYRAKDRKSFALDFRETAPAASRREQYVKDGKPVRSLSLNGALAVAVPSEVAGLVEAHKKFATLPMAVLAAPAIKLASDGFRVDTAMGVVLNRNVATLKRYPDLARVYLPGGESPKPGDLIRQPELAETLKAIAQHGAQVFYQGWIGQAIVEYVRQQGGVMAQEDLKNYKPVWREPLIGSYRGRQVIGMPPPSSGGVAILQMLNVLEGYKFSEFKPDSASYLHLLAEVMKHSFADRAEHLGDPDFVHVPVRKLTAKDYANWVRGRITPEKTQVPTYYGYFSYNAEKGSTTHFSVIDGQGNAVACTQTVNTRFGSKLLAPRTGIVLNNEMDDFAIHAGADNYFGLTGNRANALEGGKRPLSSMAPTIVLNGSRPELVVGGAGGPRIINGTLQTLLNVLEFKMPVVVAVAQPRIHHQWLPDVLNVENTISPEIRKELETRGHVLRGQGIIGNVVQAITWDGTTMNGAADPRKVERARTE
jgi:gamma-glutamyltranspeptidase/glutathione hydrolase